MNVENRFTKNIQYRI